MFIYIFKTYTLRDETVTPEKWSLILKDLRSRYQGISPDILIGGLIISLKGLENPGIYDHPEEGEEREGIRHIIKSTFYNRYVNSNRLFKEWKGLQKVFFTYANELSFKIIGDALFSGYLSHAFKLFPNETVSEWLHKEGGIDKRNEMDLGYVYEKLPWASKDHLLTLLRKRRRSLLGNESLDPIPTLMRRWNMERFLESTDGMYYFDVVDKLIKENKPSLIKDNLVESVIEWSTKQFLEIDTGIAEVEDSLTPTEEENILDE